MKSFFCVVLAVLIALTLCACKGDAGYDYDPSTVGGDTSGVDAGSAKKYYGFSKGTVMFIVNDDSRREIKIEDLTALEFAILKDGDVEYNGPRFTEVMELIGAAEADKLMIRLSDGETEELEVADINVEDSIFAIQKAGQTFGLNSSVCTLLACRMNDGTIKFVSIPEAISFE